MRLKWTSCLKLWKSPTPSSSSQRDSAIPARKESPVESKNIEPLPPFDIQEHVLAISAPLDIHPVLTPISEGAFASVWLATEKKAPSGGQLDNVAIKVWPWTPGKLPRQSWTYRTKMEVHFLSHLQHPNIVKFLDHLFFAPEAGSAPTVLLIKTELLDFTLFHVTTHFRPLTFTELPRLATQVGEALSWMHSKQVVHHDVKSDNVMLSLPNMFRTVRALDLTKLGIALQTCTYKLIDFNLAKEYAQKKTNRSQTFERELYDGTEMFMSPEKKALGKTLKPYNPYLAEAYSYGVTLLAALMGESKLFIKLKKTRNILQTLESFIEQQSYDDRARYRKYFAALQSLLSADAKRAYIDEAMEKFRLKV